MTRTARPIRESPWLGRAGERDAARLRFVAFPYAGGGVAMYRRWSAALPADVELWVAQLPGRENRLREPALRDLPALVRHVGDALAQTLGDGPPVVLFGHSLGALICFEVARDLASRGLRPPRALIVSARTPPHLEPRSTTRHLMDDASLVRELQRLDGIPPEIASNAEMLALILPALRADLALDETYVHDAGVPPLTCPILAVGGLEDPEVSLDELSAWRVHTSAAFAVQACPGAHFFLQTHADQLLAMLSAYLVRLPD